MALIFNWSSGIRHMHLKVSFWLSQIERLSKRKKEKKTCPQIEGDDVWLVLADFGVDVFNFALAPVIGGQPILSSAWMHFSGHISPSLQWRLVACKRKMPCHWWRYKVRKERTRSPFHIEEPGDSRKGLYWYMIIAPAVLFKNTEEVKERPLAWFISEALRLIISCPYFESGPLAKQSHDCPTLWYSSQFSITPAHYPREIASSWLW